MNVLAMSKAVKAALMGAGALGALAYAGKDHLRNIIWRHWYRRECHQLRELIIQLHSAPSKSGFQSEAEKAKSILSTAEIVLQTVKQELSKKNPDWVVVHDMLALCRSTIADAAPLLDLSMIT